MAVLGTGHERDVWYLASKINELTMGVGSILPDIFVNTGTKLQSIRWGSHQPETGDPTRELRETVSATFQLITELQNTDVTVDARMLAPGGSPPCG